MISLPINPFLANQPVMGPQPPEDFVAAPAMMLLPNSAGSPASMMLLPNTPVMGPQPPVASAPPALQSLLSSRSRARDKQGRKMAPVPVMGPQPPPGYEPPPRQILPNLSSILSAAPAAEPAPALEPITLAEKAQQFHADGMKLTDAWEKAGMKKYGTNTWYDPEANKGLFIGAKDIPYDKPGYVKTFFGWEDDPQFFNSELKRIIAGTDKNSTNMESSYTKYLNQQGYKPGQGGKRPPLDVKMDALDYAWREEGRKQQTKGSFWDSVIGTITGALPAIAGGIVAGPVGAAVAGGISKGVKGGLTDGLLGAATGYLGGVGLNKLAPDLSNLAGIGTSGLGRDIGLLNTLQSVGLPVTDTTSLGLGGLENVSNVPGDALFDTSVANQIATGSGVGAGALGPTDVLANAITPNLTNYVAAAAPALNPFTGLADLSSGGGFVNPGALGGTTLDQVANTLDTTLPLSDIAPSLMGPQPPPGFYDTLEKAKTLADLGGTVTDLFSEQPEQGGMLSAPSFSFPGSGSQGTPYRSIQFPTGWGRVPTFNLFGNPFQRG